MKKKTTMTIKTIKIVDFITKVNNFLFTPSLEFNKDTLLYGLFYSIVYILLLVLISNNVYINIDTELYTKSVEYISVNLGLMKIKYSVNGTCYAVIANYRSICEIKSFILISLVGLGTISTLFIINNINFVILNILAMVFTRAFVLNFYEKHLIFNLSNPNSKLSFVAIKACIKYLIKKILDNIEKIILLFLKLIILSVFIIIILRSTIFMLLMGNNDNLVSNGLILILPLPFYNYFFNLAMKKIKKEDITSDDYYIYNKFVINNINLYRITYILSINYIIHNYYYVYILTITVFMALLSILSGYYLLYVKPNKCRHPLSSTAYKPLTLKCTGGEAMAIITSFVALAPVLQDACNRGYIHYHTNEGTKKYVSTWKTTNLGFKTPHPYYIGLKTMNITTMPEKLYLKMKPEYESIAMEHREKLRDSPILNMAYYQKHNDIKRSLDFWGIKPYSYFSNPLFYGSVLQTVKGRFLIITIIRNDSAGSIFMPSFYLPDGTTESEQKIRDIREILQMKYNLLLPVGAPSSNGYMIFTQAESLGTNGLFRVWRPSIQYMEPECFKQNTTVGDYYKISEDSMVRLKEFNYNKYRNSVKVIKEMAGKNAIASFKVNNQNNIKRGVMNELWADRMFRVILNLFLIKGTETVNGNEYKMYDEGWKDKFKDEQSIHALMKEARKKLSKELAISREQPAGEENTAEEFIAFKNSIENALNNNHVTMGKSDPNSGYRYLYARRLQTVDRSLWSPDFTSSTYISIYKHGVIEGFQEYCHRLGNLSHEFVLPLNKSREDLIRRIGSKYFFMGPNAREGLSSVYGMSVNRLTFEFFEIRPDSNIFGYKNTTNLHPHNCEVYSIIDTLNDNSKFTMNFDSGLCEMVIPKHDYNFFDDKDEHSIRKFMDLIYKHDNGHLSYKSNIANSLDIAPTWDNDLKNKPIKISNMSIGRNPFNHVIIKRESAKWAFKPHTGVTLNIRPYIIENEWFDEEKDIWDGGGYYARNWKKTRKILSTEKVEPLEKDDVLPKNHRRRIVKSQLDLNIEALEKMMIRDSNSKGKRVVRMPITRARMPVLLPKS